MATPARPCISGNPRKLLFAESGKPSPDNFSLEKSIHDCIHPQVILDCEMNQDISNQSDRTSEKLISLELQDPTQVKVVPKVVSPVNNPNVGNVQNLEKVPLRRSTRIRKQVNFYVP